MKVRKPAVAGQFYPENREILNRKIQSFLKNVELHKERDLTSGGKIYGLIVPHAGYDFSGQTAGYAFKQIEGEQYGTVIILGPSHQFPFRGVAVYPDGYFRTSLGDVEINAEFTKRLTSHRKYIIEDEDPHIGEHSLEVVLPFLQTVLKGFKIVPICMGDQSFEVCDILATAIAETIQGFPDEKMLIVASSDFYHGYDYDECKKSVAESVFLISGYNVEKFHYTFREQNAACGGGCIVTCMLASKKIGASRAIPLYSTNSGDVTGTISGYVVGYASFILTNPLSLSESEKWTLIEIARNSIIAAITKSKFKELKPSNSAGITKKRGCFVTIKKQGELRGCIGYVLPVKPLYQAVSEMAVEAATADPRFPPLGIDELAEIKLEISVLTPLHRIKSIDEIQVGRDGLYLKKGEHSGLLLPQVAVEEGWDRLEFLENVCWKAGLHKDAWKDAELYKFQAEIFGDED